MCTCDEIGKACIYIVRGDTFKKTPVDTLLALCPYHLAHVPSLVSILQIKEKNKNQLLEFWFLVLFCGKLT